MSRDESTACWIPYSGGGLSNVMVVRTIKCITGDDDDDDDHDSHVPVSDKSNLSHANDKQQHPQPDDTDNSNSACHNDTDGTTEQDAQVNVKLNLTSKSKNILYEYVIVATRIDDSTVSYIFHFFLYPNDIPFLSLFLSTFTSFRLLLLLSSIQLQVSTIFTFSLSTYRATFSLFRHL